MRKRIDKPRARFLLALGLATVVLAPASAADRPDPFAEPDFFPLAVWLQSPANAERYRKAGINCYAGLWRGPTEEQLAVLKKAGMRVICGQNAIGLEHRDDPGIVAWMHGDEPDNAQSLGQGKGWGPPIPPEKIVADYRKLKESDPSRPVLLNLGQGVAWDGWHGRGVRSNHPEDYPLYIEGCDIVSFDIYPAVHDRPAVAGKLWYVGRGVQRLVGWSQGRKTVWNCIECTRIGNPDKKPTPHQVRCEVWMSIIHGSRGLIYFVHQFEPVFREAALLDDPEMLAQVTTLNRQITELAPVIKRPAVAGTVLLKLNPGEDAVPAESSRAKEIPPGIEPLAFTVREQDGWAYLFAVEMLGRKCDAAFTARLAAGAEAEVEVLGESRKIPMNAGVFLDTFAPWEVRLYRWRQRR